ncbi:lymphoid-restricted membrane protein-like isoform X3 [Centruroides sculpturatus]|uniref:lymphoid-restricted membrane protein-like isoform X3 n=1 Tax=Centruroides sculpturatus TaxID=218467 RepID=UPI000C6CFCB5|nr:lymphoid-restricted membrane protein-like isoform X3 [Centruroides sculpturatus]
MKTPSHRLAKPSDRMPDLTERSESDDDDDHPQDVSEKVFPSLPDSLLDRLSAADPSASGRDREIESEFVTLSLAFKTDRFTLPTRLELLQRHRNAAEENAESELREVRSALETLNRFVPDPAARELFVDLQKHLDVIRQCVRRVAGKSELYGAVQQEDRLSRAVEVMVRHVENLRRLRERERGELEETRRLLLETRLLSGGKRDEAALRRSPLVDSGGSPTSAAVSRRRASVAGYQRLPPFDPKMAINSWILRPASGRQDVEPAPTPDPPVVPVPGPEQEEAVAEASGVPPPENANSG